MRQINYIFVFCIITVLRKQYEFIGTKVLKLIPKHLHTLPLQRFKKDFTTWFLFKFNTDLLL